MKTAEEIVAEIKYQSTLPEGDRWSYKSSCGVVMSGTMSKLKQALEE